MIESWEQFIAHSKTLNPVEQAKDADISYFVQDYFEKCYIGSKNVDGTRKRPRYALALWNVHESTLTSEKKILNIFKQTSKIYSIETILKH